MSECGYTDQRGGFVGLGIGAAMMGMVPVVELLFMDFALVAADQYHQPGGQAALYVGRAGQFYHGNPAHSRAAGAGMGLSIRRVSSPGWLRSLD